jgi:hypothetical protein
MAHDSDLGGDERGNRDSAPSWSVMDVEDLRDFAKTMTIDDLTVVMARSRHAIQKKLIELGLSAARTAPMPQPKASAKASAIDPEAQAAPAFRSEVQGSKPYYSRGNRRTNAKRGSR